MSRTFPIRSAAAVALIAAVAACAEPPTETMTAAEEAQQGAVAAGAEEYAPQAMAAVAEAKAALDAELAVQEGRMSIRRSYKHAEELATAYRTAADQATTAAAAGKEQARLDATALIAESRVALDETRGLLAVAPAGKGTRADLAAMRADLDAAETVLAEADAAVMAERYLEAKSKVTSAREIIDRVRLAVTTARGIATS